MGEPIDDYDLLDRDFDELIRRGQEWLEWEAQQNRSESKEN